MTNVYYTCPFVPSELIAACGLTPCRVTPSLDRDSRIEGMCSFTSAWFDYLEHKRACEKSFIAIFSTACDQMRRAFDLFNLQGSNRFFLLNVPSTTTEKAFSYYLAELRRLISFLCDISGYTPNWQRLVEYPPNQAGHSEPCETAIKIAVTGGPVPVTALDFIHSFLNARGATIVLDAVENAILPHVSHSQVQKGNAALETLAKAYFDIPAIWKRPNTPYFKWITALVREHNVEGVILFRQSFCDLWHSQGQELSKWLSLPLLELDLDGKSDLSQSAVSRVEAFLEALQ